MSRRAKCYGDKVVEGFFSMMKTGRIYRFSWINRRQARLAIYVYIEVFYNRKCRHSYLGNLSPAEFEFQSAEASTAQPDCRSEP